MPEALTTTFERWQRIQEHATPARSTRAIDVFGTPLTIEIRVPDEDDDGRPADGIDLEWELQFGYAASDGPIRAGTWPASDTVMTGFHTLLRRTEDLFFPPPRHGSGATITGERGKLDRDDTDLKRETLHLMSVPFEIAWRPQFDGYQVVLGDGCLGGSVVCEELPNSVDSPGVAAYQTLRAVRHAVRDDAPLRDDYWDDLPPFETYRPPSET